MADTTSGPSGGTTDSNSPPARGWAAFTRHISSHKTDVALWCTRLATIIFTLGFMLPLFGNPYQSYYKALMANAATSALRLHQRLPQVHFTMEFFYQFLLEDSAHYLFFSLIFLYAAPITFVLLPVVLFAVLHTASYSLTLLDTLGHNSGWGARLLISLVETQSRNILRMVAFNEIFLMPFSITMIFAGKTTILTPFLYYRFLGLRYSSRRNPYCRTLFHELRLAMDSLTYSPRCPVWARNVVIKAIAFVSNLAPATAQ